MPALCFNLTRVGPGHIPLKLNIPRGKNARDVRWMGSPNRVWQLRSRSKPASARRIVWKRLRIPRHFRNLCKFHSSPHWYSYTIVAEKSNTAPARPLGAKIFTATSIAHQRLGTSTCPVLRSKLLRSVVILNNAVESPLALAWSSRTACRQMHLRNLLQAFMTGTHGGISQSSPPSLEIWSIPPA